MGKGKVICSLSGGVDSAVAAVLIHEAIDLLRHGEGEQVLELFRGHYNIPLVDEGSGGTGCMRELRKQEQVAIEAVARHFSATWDKASEDSPDAYLAIAGKRIAVEVTAIKQRFAERGDLTKPRLRFDRVALRLVGGLLLASTASGHWAKSAIAIETAPIAIAKISESG